MKQEIAMVFLLWLALQVPLGIVLGQFIHFGMAEEPETELQAAHSERQSVLREAA
jgi:hypothetical protein